MRFDWEPRPIPEGLVQIQRNQKRDAADQNLKDYTNQSTQYTSRSQWEEASQRKSQLVAQILQQGEQERVLQAKNNNNSLEQPHNLSVIDVLRKESAEKRALRTAEKELAALRREALLQQAAAIAAAKESQREALAQESRLTALKERDPEVQEYMRKIRAKELAEDWEKQQKEKLLTLHEKSRASEKESGGGGGLPSTSSSFVLQGGAINVGPSKEKLLEDLKLQLEEFKSRKAEEKSKNAEIEALVQRKWGQDKEAAIKEEQERIEKQLEFLENMEIERKWQIKQISERALAEAEAEKQLVAEIKLKQSQAVAESSNAKIQRQEETERELQERKDAENALRAKNVAEKQAERLRLAEEAQKYAQSVQEESQRRQQQAQEILKVNQALVEAERLKKQALIDENICMRSAADENAGQRSSEKGVAKQAQRAEAALFSSQLAAQIKAKEVKSAAQSALEKARQDHNKIIEEERRRLITEAIAAYKILK